MSHLYLIRHPVTRPDPAVPASEWDLSDGGRLQRDMLLEAPFWGSVTQVYTSSQYKTKTVGQAAFAILGIPTQAIADLDEARRDTWFGTEAFQAAQQAFFAQPDRPPVPEWESADAARARFVAAMDGILAQHPADESLAVVTHATVLTLYLAHLRHEAPEYEFWRTIGFAEVFAVDRAAPPPVDFVRLTY